ncbi:MAG TPA: S8 family serine peptidase, partial [Orrella sp.]
MLLIVSGLTATAPDTLAQMSPSDFETPEFYANWGLDPIRAQYAWSQGFTGTGVRMAIVDSPIQLSHPEFAGRVWGEIPSNQFPVPGVPIPFHGTHVMGLAGAARNGVGMMGSAFDAELVGVVNGELNTAGYYGITNWGPAVVVSGASVMNGSFVSQAQPQRVVNNALNPNWVIVDYLAVRLELVDAYFDNIDFMAKSDVVMVFSAGNDRALRNTSG